MLRGCMVFVLAKVKAEVCCVKDCFSSFELCGRASCFYSSPRIEASRCWIDAELTESST